MKSTNVFFIRIDNPIIKYTFTLFQKLGRQKVYQFTESMQQSPFKIYDDFGLKNQYLHFANANRLATTDFIKQLSINDIWLYRGLHKIFGSNDKIKDLVYLYLAEIYFSINKEVPFFFQKNIQADVVLPKGLLIHKIIINSNLTSKVNYSFFLSFIIWLLSFGSIVLLFLKSIFILPTLKRKAKAHIAKELVWGFDRDSILNDSLVFDNERIKKEDIVYFNFKRQPRFQTSEIKQLVEKNNIKFVLIDFSHAAINKEYFINILYQFKLLFLALRTLFHPSEYFMTPILAKASLHTLQMYRWMGHIDVKYYFSTQNHELLQTNLLNQNGVQTVLLERSDYIAHNDWDHLFPSHNILLAWNKSEASCWEHFRYYDEVYEIGCLFKYTLTNLERNDLRQKLDIPDKKKIIVFFDSGTGDSMHFNSLIFNNFVDLVIEFSRIFPHAICIVKPKRLFQWKVEKIAKKLEFSENIQVINPDQHGVEKIGCLGDIVIGMGINSAATIAMVNHIPTLYFDQTNNIFHPFFNAAEKVVFTDVKDIIHISKKYLNDPSQYLFPEEIIYFDKENYIPKERIVARLAL